MSFIRTLDYKPHPSADRMTRQRIRAMLRAAAFKDLTLKDPTVPRRIRRMTSMLLAVEKFAEIRANETTKGPSKSTA